MNKEELLKKLDEMKESNFIRILDEDLEIIQATIITCKQFNKELPISFIELIIETLQKYIKSNNTLA